MNEEKHEHEILVAIVVRTDVERETAYLWLLERLRLIQDDLAQNDDETHVDSFWIAEDDRPNKAPQQGLRSAVFLPEGVTQEDASGMLTTYVVAEELLKAMGVKAPQE